MNELRHLVWDAWNVPHIALHDMTPEEVEAVCHAEPVLYRRSYKERLMLLGETPAGRVLAIVIGPVPGAPTGTYYRRSQPINAPSSLSLNRTVAKGSGQDWCARRRGLLVVDWAVSEGGQVSGCVPVEKASDYSGAVRRRWGHTGPDRTWTGS